MRLTDDMRSMGNQRVQWGVRHELSPLRTWAPEQWGAGSTCTVDMPMWRGDEGMWYVCVQNQLVPCVLNAECVMEAMQVVARRRVCVNGGDYGTCEIWAPAPVSIDAAGGEPWVHVAKLPDGEWKQVRSNTYGIWVGGTTGYTISLTDAEVDTLAWAAHRGYFPSELYEAMVLADCEPDEVDTGCERTWLIPEQAAWSMSEHAEFDPDSFLACIGGDLHRKCMELWDSIV